MGKAVLVMDMPEGCAVCPITECGLDKMDRHSRADGCPLRELPEKKQLSYDSFEYDLLARVWNNCIDTITGGAR